VFKWLAAGTAVVWPSARTVVPCRRGSRAERGEHRLRGPVGAGAVDIPHAYLVWYMGATRPPGPAVGRAGGIGRSKATTAVQMRPASISARTGRGRGPMQFEPATFTEYAVDADPANALSVYDRPMRSTRPPMLCANGAASPRRPGSAGRSSPTTTPGYVAACWPGRPATPRAPAGAAAAAIAFALGSWASLTGGAPGGRLRLLRLVYAAYAATASRSPVPPSSAPRRPRSRCRRSSPGPAVLAGSDGTPANPGHS